MSSDPWSTDQSAEAYAQFCREFGRYRDSSRWLVQSALKPSHHQILDWGSGTGVTSEQILASAHQRAVVFGLEPSDAMAALAPWRRHGKRLARICELESLENAAIQCVLGNSMWWILPSPRDALSHLSTKLCDGAVVAWSTPALYLGESPSAEELQLHIMLDELIRTHQPGALEASLGADQRPTAPRALLDPVGTMRQAGLNIVAHHRHARTCSAVEWWSHLLLPPLQPKWLQAIGLERRRHFVARVREVLSNQSAHEQGWYITVGRWYTGASIEPQ